MAVDFLVFTATIGRSKTVQQQAVRPLGIHKVAWIARKHGYNALAISKLQLLSEDQIFELCRKFIGPKTLIGIGTSLIALPTSISPTQKRARLSPLNAFINAVQRLRKLYNNKVLVGGQIAEKYVEVFNADYMISGLTVENDVAKFLDKHFRNGIQRRPYDWNITSCDFAWEETDFVQRNETLPLETGRECIFKCKFCAWSEIGRKKGTFEKNMNILRDHMIENYEKYNVTRYSLVDDTFNDDDDRMNEWCDMIEALPFKPYYGGFVRLDLFEKYQETAKRLHRNGLRGCSFGIESFHPKAAHIIGKAFNAKKGKQFLDYAWEELFDKNIFIITTNIIGLPGESIESSEETHRWYKERPHILELWSPLYISRNQEGGLANAVFGKDPGLWGYEYPDGSDFNWKSDLMTFELATKKTYEFFEDANPHHLDCWTHHSYFSIKNMEPKEYFAMTPEDRAKLVKTLQIDVDDINKKYFRALHEYGDSQ